MTDNNNNNNNNNMFYQNNMCQKTGECVRNTTAACVNNGQYFNNVQTNATAASNQQTTYLDNARCCSQPLNVCDVAGIPCTMEVAPINQSCNRPNITATSPFCCPTAPAVYDVPCRNERQLGCQPPPCCPTSSQAQQPRCDLPDKNFLPDEQQCQFRYPGQNRAAECSSRRNGIPMEAHAGRLKGRHPLDCCDPYANVSYKPIPPNEKWPLDSCFSCDDRGCGIKVDECKQAEQKRCCTPRTEYMRMHGEMARQLLTGQMNIPMKLKGGPPCNICERIMPLCRGYYREYECPMPIDARTGRRRLKSEQYWKPCQEIEFANEYRQYMSVPNNGLIKKLRRKLDTKKEWNF